MWPSIKPAWIPFNHDLEGVLTCLYADKIGLVSSGMGNLLDPMSAAIGLPWRLPDGSLATRGQVAAAWTAVKRDPRSADGGWKYAIKIPANNIRLMLGDVEALVYSKLDTNDRGLTSRFSDWETRPADAQLAVHSMVWAMGPGFWAGFPKFRKAWLAGDYEGCAAECDIAIPMDVEGKPIGGTIHTRNDRNKQLFANASQVSGDPSADRGTLLWSA